MLQLNDVVASKIFKILDVLLDKELRQKVDTNRLEELRKWLSNNRKTIISQVGDNAYCIHTKFEGNLLNLVIEGSGQRFMSHYTTLEAALKILNNNTIWLTSLIGLNDNSELDFSDLSDIKEPYHHKRIDFYNSRMILSLSKQIDDLNQWRLYGDDGKGVSLEFAYNTNFNPGFSDFELRRIFYGDELVVAYRKVKKIINFYFENSSFFAEEFDRQKNFFKDPIYKNEQEVRLISLNVGDKPNKWYLNRFNIYNSYKEYALFNKQPGFPLLLRSITLGPKCPNKELNKAQIQKYLRDHYPEPKIAVKLSTISSYR